MNTKTAIAATVPKTETVSHFAQTVASRLNTAVGACRARMTRCPLARILSGTRFESAGSLAE